MKKILLTVIIPLLMMSCAGGKNIQTSDSYPAGYEDQPVLNFLNDNWENILDIGLIFIFDSPADALKQ